MAYALSRSRQGATSSGTSLNAAQKLVYETLGSIRSGFLTVIDHEGRVEHFGDEKSTLKAEMIVTDPAFFGRTVRGGSLGFGESYMDGLWHERNEDLTSLLGMLVADKLRTPMSRLLGLRVLLDDLLQNPINAIRSQQNVAHHYDLSNEFFSLMLDGSMTYSCGILDEREALASEENSLAAMQRRKYGLISEKLSLMPGQSLIDIGCGWGGMLAHAATHHGVSGTGITLSKNQLAFARERFAREQLTNVSAQLTDYRDMTGSFDKLVSIGMLEHVGRSHYKPFAEKCAQLLKPGGIGLVHFIGMKDASGGEDPWIRKYIFPGGHLPDVATVIKPLQDAGMTIGHIENFKLHYAETLRYWKQNVDRNRRQIRALGSEFDTRFLRMWDYYLQACEASFRYGKLELYHILFSRSTQWTFPLRFRWRA